MGLSENNNGLSAFRLRFNIPLKRLRTFGQWLVFASSVICITALILYAGIYHTEVTKKIDVVVIHVCQIVFSVNILYNLIFLFRSTITTNRPLKWILDIAVLVTMLPLLYPDPSHPWIPVLEKILYSHWFAFSILGIYSVVEVSYGLGRLIGKRTNPSLLLGGSFLFFIIVGTLVLMMPRCTVNGIEFIDSLFVATSAVSITGLTPVEISSVFTPLGVVVLGLLIEVGALGVLTFTSFFALFFAGNTSIYNQLMVRDLVYSKNSDTLLPTLAYIFFFTITIEIIGGFIIYFTLPNDFPLTEEADKILFSWFQAVSAFCNAGFTWLPDGMSNSSLMHSNQIIYIMVGLLVMAGSIGFPILVNIKNILVLQFVRFKDFVSRRPKGKQLNVHLYDINTKVVLYTSLWITVFTIILFLAFEWNNTLAGMSIWEKIVQAFFNSSIPRSSGFASVNPASFLPATFVMVVFLMWIGGASQSTGGGVKVNTFAAILLNLKSIVTDKKYITVFKRTISVGSVRRANAVVCISIVSFFAFAIVLTLLEPDIPLKSLMFELWSALFTVGSSLGITPDLGIASKVLICVAMFVGRVGILSLLMGLCARRNNDSRIYPYDNIIIN